MPLEKALHQLTRKGKLRGSIELEDSLILWKVVLLRARTLPGHSSLVITFEEESIDEPLPIGLIR